ncbi:ATP-binding protein [Pseudoalteromonas luteoviolacea]|uniref:histidine kinase n=1 Tax=Pseudoalteromonas luteoviolacea S4054 TaxID=1129367 RepID=A0A0F6ACH7_9GAMM|nr:ATP-binding protein [Pseudoalteromonas luteoviolacea]AOT08473.1 histidine kinase [Pseudoalteromonas luteoviolacea]AOT13389.1 histidine kinase [Pseudoalteromonas luteoviolacea]AOT18302.1 histidine kinase [Pseudoalteromonas luteoviolacea]KKE83531.1 histidine kinase [Pseudoalteromonas luteoviolacea S4054]KZN75968.1 histidine kinase [Pseudoalteromonas luteoviolacea S4047-1]
MYLIRFTFGFIVLCFSLSVSAQQYVYNGIETGVNLHDKGLVLAAKDDTRFPVSFGDVESWASKLTPQKERALFSGRYWLVTKIKNISNYEQLVLYPYNTVLSNIETRIYSPTDVKRYYSGGMVQNEFAFHYGNTIELLPKQDYYVVTLFESDYFYTPIKLELVPVKDFKEQVVIDNLIMIICFSVGIVLGLYNLLIYIGSKDLTHLYYAIFAATMVFAWSHFFHISDQLFGFYSAHLHWLGFTLSPISNALFYNCLLKLKEEHPNLSSASIWVGVIAAIGTPFSILFPGFGFLWATLSTGVALCLGLYIGILRISEGFKPARYFILAYVCMAVPNMIGNFTNLGLLPPIAVNLYLIGLVGVALDAMFLAFAVADKVRLTSEENIELNKNLEAKVLKRTYELEQLASELRDASEAKSRFLANMSHEIRTPMTSIIGYADGIILGDIKPHERNHAITVILQNSRHVLGLINDILDMSKIEANRLEVELIEANLFQSIAHVESLLGKQIRDKGLEFDLNYQFPLPDFVVIDPTRLRQILLNLTSNALKFTSVGKISIEVSCKGDRLYISVKDTGIGMTTEEQKELFSAFYQADSSTTRKYGGTGLGLNISKSLAQKLDGDIEVESEVGSGTSFTLSLSLFTTERTKWVNSFEEIHHQHDTYVQADSELDSEALKGEVLLAEDHSDNCRLITRILERMGLNVTAVENGQLAVQAVLDNEFDLILMDIQMPVMDGEQAFNFIQATGCTAPVIALTANTMSHEVERYIKLGFTDHLAKPIDRAQFAKKISHYLNITVDDDLNLPDEEFKQLKMQYIDGLHEQLVQLQNQLKYKDYEGLARSIHALKGTSAMFDCHDIYQTVSQIDTLLKQDNFHDVEKALSRLFDLINKVIDESDCGEAV